MAPEKLSYSVSPFHRTHPGGSKERFDPKANLSLIGVTISCCRWRVFVAKVGTVIPHPNWNGTSGIESFRQTFKPTRLRKMINVDGNPSRRFSTSSLKPTLASHWCARLNILPIGQDRRKPRWFSMFCVSDGARILTLGNPYWNFQTILGSRIRQASKSSGLITNAILSNWQEASP